MEAGADDRFTLQRGAADDTSAVLPVPRGEGDGEGDEPVSVDDDSNIVLGED